MTPSTYLILEPISIIASDLSLSVQDHDSSGIVLVATTLEEAMTLVNGKPSVRLAFLHANPIGFAETELGRALAGRGAVCVFMGDAAERAKKKMIVLERPFSSENVAAVLAQLTALTV